MKPIRGTFSSFSVFPNLGFMNLISIGVVGTVVDSSWSYIQFVQHTKLVLGPEASQVAWHMVCTHHVHLSQFGSGFLCFCLSLRLFEGLMYNSIKGDREELLDKSIALAVEPCYLRGVVHQ